VGTGDEVFGRAEVWVLGHQRKSSLAGVRQNIGILGDIRNFEIGKATLPL